MIANTWRSRSVSTVCFFRGFKTFTSLPPPVAGKGVMMSCRGAGDYVGGVPHGFVVEMGNFQVATAGGSVGGQRGD